MSELSEISESTILAWTDPASFHRGQRYFQDGHILNPRRQGNVLKALCAGSRLEPYRIQITLDPAGIAQGDCSCPVGVGGHCKHAVALLLTWLHEPGIFSTIEELENALDRRSKAELIVLIQRMLKRHPDLEAVLELPIVAEAETAPPVNAELIRRRTRGAFAGLGYQGWEDAYDVAQQLLEVAEIGDDYAAVGRWEDAAAVYQIVMDETLDHYSIVRDEVGYLHEVVDRCTRGLGACLSATEEPSRREALLKALFSVYRWDLDFGGIEMAYSAQLVILRQATTEEKRQVAQWVRDVLPTDSSWEREACGRFLLQLEEAWLDDEGFLEICRQTGRREDLVRRLLALKRLEEAAAAVREAKHYQLLNLADLFVDEGYDELAEALVRERMSSRQGTWGVNWLKEKALRRGDQEEALTLAERLFWDHPTLGGYREVEALARPLGRWDELRKTLIARLDEEQRHVLLIEIYLQEDEVDRALETVQEMNAASARVRVDVELTARVAQAAEEARPRDAIRLYVEAAERLIAYRGRHNYATAAAYLRRVRRLYQRLGEASTWESYVAGLRDGNRRLRALKDELNKAGL